MSSIQRYDAWPQEWPFEDEHGDLVTYEDHRKIVEELEAKLAKAVECLGPCITLLDGLVEYSKREIEWDEEDTFRMGEWFESGDLERIESARATLAELSSVSCDD